MKNFDLNKIIEAHQLDEKKVAERLFPTAKYPLLALNRIRKGESFLDTKQLAILENLTGLSLADMLGQADKWSASAKEGILLFTKRDYIAKVSSSFHVDLYKGDKRITSFLIQADSISVENFINMLNSKIELYEQFESND